MLNEFFFSQLCVFQLPETLTSIMRYNKNKETTCPQTHFIPLLGISMIKNFINPTNKIEIIYIIYICNFILFIFIDTILSFQTFFFPLLAPSLLTHPFPLFFFFCLSHHWRNYLIKSSKVTSTRPALAIRVRIPKPIKPSVLPFKFESLIPLLLDKSSLGPVCKISYLPFEAQS